MSAPAGVASAGVGRHRRRLVLTVRGAADLPASALGGSPYCELHLDGRRLGTTSPDRAGGSAASPAWNTRFEIDLPGSVPSERLVLDVVVRRASVLGGGGSVGSGRAELAQLLVAGREEARIALSGGGVVWVGAEMLAPPAGVPGGESAAGTVLGAEEWAGKVRPPRGLGGVVTAPAAAAAGPRTPLLGAAQPGGYDDPSAPTYGILGDA